MKRPKRAVLIRLLDFRTPEQRKVAIARYDREFANWQAKVQQKAAQSRWEKLRRAVG